MIGILDDDTNPMVNVMKLDKAPEESYADIGGLEDQIQEIKVGKGERGTHAFARTRTHTCTHDVRFPSHALAVLCRCTGVC